MAPGEYVPRCERTPMSAPVPRHQQVPFADTHDRDVGHLLGGAWPPGTGVVGGVGGVGGEQLADAEVAACVVAACVPAGAATLGGSMVQSLTVRPTEEPATSGAIFRPGSHRNRTPYSPISLATRRLKVLSPVRRGKQPVDPPGTTAPLADSKPAGPRRGPTRLRGVAGLRMSTRTPRWSAHRRRGRLSGVSLRKCSPPTGAPSTRRVGLQTPTG